MVQMPARTRPQGKVKGGKAMVLTWQRTPWRQAMETEMELLKMETQVEQSRRRVWVTPKVRRAKADLMTHVSEVEKGTWKTTAEPEQLRTAVELERKKSQTEPLG